MEHFSDGRLAWASGVSGLFTRIRGIAVPTLLAVLSMGTLPFWWPNSFGKKYVFILGDTIISSVLFLGAITSAGLYYLRDRSIRSQDIKYKLHELAHFLRDKQTRAYERSLKKEESAGESSENERFCDFAGELCERIKNYFSVLSHDQSINSVIRLATWVKKNGQYNLVYKTVGRSSGLNTMRSKTSEDIQAIEGIPRFLSEEKKSRGVLIYHDIKEAAKIGAFKITENERLYPDDIKSMMVAPINGWDGKAQSVIGILYVTSREDDTFSIKYVDSILFIADLIAPTIAFIVDRLRSTKRKGITQDQQKSSEMGIVG